MLNWLTTHKRWLIPTGLASILIFMFFSVTLHLQHRRQQVQEEAMAVKVAADIAERAAQKTQKTADSPPADLPPEMIPEKEIPLYVRQPSPSEVTGRIEGTDSYGRKAEEDKLKALQIVWPLYFFSIMKRDQETARVMLDASENGFGVIVVTDISLKKYPGILSSRPGDRIWLAGRISAIDTQATGQIGLVTDYLGFADNHPSHNEN